MFRHPAIQEACIIATRDAYRGESVKAVVVLREAHRGKVSEQDIIDQFTRAFTWGVEGDDPLVGLAFDGRVLPKGARIRCLMGSDIGHWDVKDWGSILDEAWEQVERGLMTEEDFHDFVFVNPAEFQTRVNPDFFKGTAVERARNAVASLVKRTAKDDPHGAAAINEMMQEHTCCLFDDKGEKMLLDVEEVALIRQMLRLRVELEISEITDRLHGFKTANDVAVTQ